MDFTILISVGFLVAGQPQGGRVRPIVQSDCRQGECWESQVLGTQLEQETPQGKLYRVTVGRRSWPMDGKPPAQFQERTQNYVYCSRTRPAYIFANPSGKGYLADLLNPVAGGEYLRYDQSSYQLYWGVCHGIYDQDVFTPAMRQKAKQLGYSVKLPSQQISLDRVTDIFKR